MHATSNQPDALETSDPILLPANANTVMVEDLRARLVLAADQDEAIILDASDTENLGQAALQLLVAARQEAARLGLRFAVRNVEPGLVERLDALGLAEPLGLVPPVATGEEGEAR